MMCRVLSPCHSTLTQPLGAIGTEMGMERGRRRCIYRGYAEGLNMDEQWHLDTVVVIEALVLGYEMPPGYGIGRDRRVDGDRWAWMHCYSSEMAFHVLLRPRRTYETSLGQSILILCSC